VHRHGPALRVLPANGTFRRDRSSVLECGPSGRIFDTALVCSRQHPGFTLTAVAVLTLGIGVNAGIFGIINGLMIRPLAGADAPGEVVGVFSRDRTIERGYRAFSYLGFADLRGADGPFAHLAGHTVALAGVEEHREGISRDDLEDIDIARHALEVVTHGHGESTDAVKLDRRRAALRRQQAIDVTEEAPPRLRGSATQVLGSQVAEYIPMRRRFRAIRSQPPPFGLGHGRPSERIFPDKPTPFESQFACAKRFRRRALGTLRELPRQCDDEAKAVLQVQGLCARNEPVPIEVRERGNEPRQRLNDARLDVVHLQGIEQNRRGVPRHSLRAHKVREAWVPEIGQIDSEPVAVRRATFNWWKGRRRQAQLLNHHEPQSFGRLTLSSFQEGHVALRHTELASGPRLGPSLLLTSDTKHFACHRIRSSRVLQVV
jgi:hypothetical protein